MDYQVLIIVIALLFTVSAGIDASRGVHTLKDFALSRGHFNTFTLTCTLVATIIGGGCIMGMAEKCYSGGIYPIVNVFGFCAQLILMALIVAPRLNRQKNTLTLGDVLEKNYSKGAKITFGLFWFIYGVGFTVLQVTALGEVFSTFTHWPLIWNIILGAGAIILYSSIGGIRAVVRTDVIQFFILMICLPVALGLVIIPLWGKPDALDSLYSSLFYPSKASTGMELFGFFSAFMLGSFLIPPMVQRIMIANQPAIARKTYLISTVICFGMCILGGAYGVIAHAINPNVSPSQAVPYLFNVILPIWFRPFAVSALIAVIMSTADSCLNASAVSFVHDIIKPLSRHYPLSDRKELRLAMGSTVLIGLIAIVFATQFYGNFLDIILFTYKCWGPTVVIPVVAALYGLKVSIQGFYTGITAGLLTVVLWDQLGIQQMTQLSSLLPGILANALSFTLHYFLEKQRPSVALS